jgi:hypothetical protein
MFADDDTNERHSQRVGVLWVPIDNLEVWLQQAVVSNRNEEFVPNTNQSTGDPSLGVKYSYLLMPELGIAGAVNVMLPTSAQGTGLKPEALILDMLAIASYRATSWLDLHLNAGYRYDNSWAVFEHTITPVQRFTAGISREDTILAGLGASSFFPIGDDMAVGPFAELSTGVATRRSNESPIRATLGTKWFSLGPTVIDIILGVDLAINGTPVEGNVMAGIPPWQVFGNLSVHLNPPKPKVQNLAAVACTDDTQCPSGQACADGYCARVMRDNGACDSDSDCTDGRVCEAGSCTVVRIEPHPTFAIEGSVLDHRTGDPVGNAIVTFSGIDASPLAVEYKTGNFVSWPIETGDGLVKITAAAPGYRPEAKAIAKGNKDQVKRVAFKLHSLSEAVTGEIKGSLKDARSGKPVRNGQVFIPILNQRIRTDHGGRFSARVKAGRYQVLISARKFVTQKKMIEIRAGDTVILNLDMRHK